MIWLLTLLAASLCGELLLTFRPFWKARRLFAVVCLVSLSFACAGLLTLQIDVWTMTLAMVGAYRAFNLSRVMEDRMHEQFARHAIRQTAVWLGGSQLLLAGGLLFAESGASLGVETLIYSLGLLQLTAALVALWSVKRQLRTSSADSDMVKISDSKLQLPSVTVAIPARNEDSQLEACLASVTASDYPKLDVIVLDDCSADRTPDIIRSYAHAGVRFIRGSEPSDGWLAKNLAYDRLYTEASGSLLLFCGVDIRFDPSSVRQLVTTMQVRNKIMLSILPQTCMMNKDKGPDRLPLLQAMRYYWEMVPPRRLFNRPPVLGSCWLIQKTSLQQAGGFDSVRRSIAPEAHFARDAITTDGYSFIRSDGRLKITSEKPLSEQTATAIQTRYPQLHRRPELVMMVAAVEAALLAGPLAVASYGLATLQLVPLVLSMVAFYIQVYVFGCLQQTVFPGVGSAVYAAFLPAVIKDIAMLHYSMYKYEFSKVYWKGRNVCFPVMHVEPHLPKSK